MKKYFLLFAMVFICFATTSLAQLKMNNPLAQKKPVFLLPSVQTIPVSTLIIPASTKVIPVHIDLVKPVFEGISLTDIKNKIKAQCDLIENLKPSLELKAERINDMTADLEWETKYAFYATGFNIERSLGDSLHFAEINFAEASMERGFKKNYHLADYNDNSDLSFYRIKQRNGDTGFVYSNIVSIKGHEIVPFKIYPNPASIKVWINFTPKQSGIHSIEVYDITGKIMLQRSLACTKKSTTEKSLDISKFSAGVYQVRISMPDKTFIAGKFIKEP